METQHSYILQTTTKKQQENLPSYQNKEVLNTNKNNGAIRKMRNG